MKDGHVEALEARLSAHRRVLRLLLSRISAEEREEVFALMDEPYPPQDGQEDPGRSRSSPRSRLMAPRCACFVKR